ncbi:MAG: response regulator [Cyanobacteria bacterium P01_A01_bin.17]
MNIHVLLIEDEANIARLLELDLSDVGYRVTVAHDGLTGLHLAQTQAPDIIVLDWQLPQLTGLEICQRLRDAGKMMPIIFATALGDDLPRKAALRAGGTDYLVKPFSTESLLRVIDEQQAMVA